MSKPRLLDLFCGAGGAAMGYARAGFEVVGVDHEPQPFYPYRFWQADALEIAEESWVLSAFDVVHASPPCQGYSTMIHRASAERQSSYPKLIAPIRDSLRRWGGPYVIENVMGARSALEAPVRICGVSVGLRVARHRLFESNISLMVPPCACGDTEIVGVYGNAPDGRRLNSRATGTIHYAASSLEDARDAMGMEWADWHGTKEAIPPLYTELLGAQLLAAVT